MTNSKLNYGYNSWNSIDDSNKDNLSETGSKSVIYLAFGSLSLIGAGLLLGKKKSIRIKKINNTRIYKWTKKLENSDFLVLLVIYL